MTQTMLSILAITLATMFAMQQHRNIAHMEMRSIRNEISVQSTGVAVDRLDEVGAMAFDRATAGDTKIDTKDSLSVGPPFLSDGQADDIDDFHNSGVQVIRVHGTDTLHFWVETTVTYADEVETDSSVAGPTKVKKVTAKVYNMDIAIADTVTLSQSFSCGSRCDW